MALVEYITDEGKEMLAQMLAGKVKLEFTKIQMGDGTLATGQSRRTMTALVNMIDEIEVYRVTVSDENVISITGIFDNSSLESGFFFREKGVFASDGSSEILFAYANAGDSAEYINPPTVELVEKQITSLYKGIQDTETEVNIKIASGIYALSEDVAELETTLRSEISEELGKKIDDAKRLTSSDDVKAITEEGYIVDAKVIREHMENTEKSETEIYKKIDESSTDAASNLKKLIKLQTVKSGSISVSESGEYTGSLSVAATGYTPVGVLSFNSGNTGMALIKIETSISGTVYFSLKNVTAKAVSGTVRLVVLYIRDDYFSWLT